MSGVKAGPIIDAQTNAQNADLDVVLKRFGKGSYFVPAYQRDADEWDDVKKSLFIESILNRLTVPAFYIAESEEDSARSEIVDGQQRITTLDAFYRGEFRLLTDDRCPYFGEYSVHYAGKVFAELEDPWKDAFGNYVINLVVLPPKMPLDLRLEIFRRINEGGTPLTGQDIRLSYYSTSSIVRYVQLVGIYDPDRTGAKRMIQSAAKLFPWPWAARNADDIETWKDWWAESRTASGQAASEMFLWYLISHHRKQVDQILANKKHLSDNLKLAFRNRGEEVLDIFCAQSKYEYGIPANVPRLFSDVGSIQKELFPLFATWVVAIRCHCLNQVSVNRNRFVALLVPGLVKHFGPDSSKVTDRQWGLIGRFISKTRDTASNLSVDFPEPKGRWHGDRGQRAQMDAFYDVASAIASN